MRRADSSRAVRLLNRRQVLLALFQLRGQLVTAHLLAVAFILFARAAPALFNSR